MYKFFVGLIACLLFCTGTGAKAFTGKGSVVIDAHTRRVLYKDNENEKLPMASTTKIMTAIVAIENAEPDMIITVSDNAQNQEGSRVYLNKGNIVTLEDLLYGLMLNSGNDAAVAIAEAIGGSVDDFVLMMNEKAEELGCRNTSFKNPSGLPEEGHYSTAYDMALIMAYAMENEMFAKITATKEHQFNLPDSTTYLRNHNKLLWRYNGCIGGKTGFTKAAGRCLVSCAERDGARLIVVTLNEPQDWLCHQNFYEKGFSDMKKVQIISKNDILCTRRINGAKINILSYDDCFLALYKGRKNNLICRLRLMEDIDEINIGTALGVAEIYSGKHKLGEVRVVSGTAIQKKYTLINQLVDIFGKALLD